MKAATPHTSRNIRGERNREEMIPLIFVIENISQLKRKHSKDHEHLLLFLHSQGEKGNGSETAKENGGGEQR